MNGRSRFTYSLPLMSRLLFAIDTKGVKMRSLSRGMLALLLAAGLGGIGGTAHAVPTRADGDVLAELKAIPGMTVEEKASTLAGYRWFWLNYRQPVDHRHPEKGWF